MEQLQVSSFKLQASSFKLQASSGKQKLDCGVFDFSVYAVGFLLAACS
ncbi:hypothetical protein [Pseudomonas viridiflava]|nr:hypothetical protein [Pseudomonas viridiflava]